MKVLKPSSIQAWRRSSKPTIIGNQLWPISCALIQNSGLGGASMSSKTRPGYSMPAAGPATLIAAGPGGGDPFGQKPPTPAFIYSGERPPALASGGGKDNPRGEL